MFKFKNLIIYVIKFYQFCLSPLFGSNKCRYLPTCSEYFMDCLDEHGLFNGIIKGTQEEQFEIIDKIFNNVSIESPDD